MKIKVALYGMDKRCEDRMLTVFKMNFKGVCEHTQIDQADTVIVDMDGKNVDETWKEFRSKHPDSPVIIMSTEPVVISETTYVSKPARLNELMDALKKTSNKDVGADLGLSSNTQKVANAMEDRFKTAVKKRGTSEKYELYYNPDKFLQGKVQAAISKSNETNQSIYIKCWSDRWIVIFPYSQYLFQNVKESQLRNLGVVQIGDEISYSEKKFSETEISDMSDTPTNQVKATPVENFIWDVTVRTARGRIPEGTSMDELYVLQRWPNLPRLSHIPNATRISAFWLDQPQSINSIMDKLAIGFEDVFTYFSAASAVDLLKRAKRNEDHLVKPEVLKVENKKKGIFAALMSKVSKNIVHKKDDED